MVSLIYFFLPVILAFGIITSYTDIKTGKIKNKDILIFLFIGFTLYLLFGLYNMTVGSLNVAYLQETIILFVLSTLLGYFFWMLGIWTPGDGKLFTIYALLVPIEIYNIGYIKNFSSFNILINTFVPMFVFLFFNILKKSSKEKKVKALKNAFNKKIVLKTILALFSYSWIITITLTHFGINSNRVTNTILILLMFIISEKVFTVSSFAVTLFISIARLFFDSTWYSLDYIGFMIFLLLQFLIFRYFILELGFSMFTSEINISDLKKGMVLAEIFYEHDEKVKTEKTLYTSFISYFLTKQNNKIIDASTEGVTDKDIKNLKKLQEKNPTLKTIKIMETLPFAPFMFFGVLITILVKGNVITFLVNLF